MDKKLRAEWEVSLGIGFVSAAEMATQLDKRTAVIAVLVGAALVGDSTYNIGKADGVSARSAIKIAAATTLISLAPFVHGDLLDKDVELLTKKLGEVFDLDDNSVQRLRLAMQTQLELANQAKDEFGSPSTVGQDDQDKRGEGRGGQTDHEEILKRVSDSNSVGSRRSRRANDTRSKASLHRRLAPHKGAAGIGRAGSWSVAPIDKFRRHSGRSKANQRPGGAHSYGNFGGSRGSAGSLTAPKMASSKKWVDGLTGRRTPRSALSAAARVGGGLPGRTLSRIRSGDRTKEIAPKWGAAADEQRRARRLALARGKGQIIGAFEGPEHNARAVGRLSLPRRKTTRTSVVGRGTKVNIPSVAPTGTSSSHDVASILNACRAAGYSHDQAGPSVKPGSTLAANGVPQQAASQRSAFSVSGFEDNILRRAVSELLDQQARLPPAGMTGFDPRLSPAWPGLKLPG